MDRILALRGIYALKHVYRQCAIGSRKESSAEHSWSCLVLADYILGSMKAKLDRLKVYELLMYHDLVEIYAGDVPIHHNREGKKERELAAMHRLCRELPSDFSKKFKALFLEFEECASPEAKFARAVDKLDAMIQELEVKDDWKGWDEKMVRKFHEEAVSAFPETRDLFEKILRYVVKEGYIHN